MASASAPSSSRKKARAVFQWKEALAGAAAGAFAKTALAPVERIKLLKQLQGSISRKLDPNTSAWQVAKTVYQQEGILAFWRGNWPNVLRTAGTSAINFTCMDYYKKVAVAPFFDSLVTPGGTSAASVERQGRQKRRRQLMTSFISGGLAGATSTTLLYPFEFLRTRLAMDMGASVQREYALGMRQCVQTIWQTDGITGFFQGYGIALTGGVVYRILFLGGYEGLKDEVLYRKASRQNANLASLTWKERMMIAQTISLSAGTICYPFDSVRRRMMMQAGQAVANRKYRNSMHCFVQVLRQEGVRGFYLGIGPNLVRSVSGALLLVGYDAAKSLLRI